jgi:hypothetical protein
LRAVVVMQQGSVVNLDVRLALPAARVSLDTRLPMAHSVVLAAVGLHHATVWTQAQRALPPQEGPTVAPEARWCVASMQLPHRSAA